MAGRLPKGRLSARPSTKKGRKPRKTSQCQPGVTDSGITALPAQFDCNVDPSSAAQAQQAEPRATPAEMNGHQGSGQAAEGNESKVSRVISDRTCCPAASDLQEKRVSWLWDGYLAAGKVSLLAGQTGSGKSTVATAIAGAVTTGCHLPGGKPAGTGSVLWFTTEEDPAQEVKARLRAVGADLARVHFPELLPDGTRGPHWSFPAAEQKLIDLARHFRAKLVVFDPITGYVANELLPDSGIAARTVMESLARVGEATGAHLLTIKHPRKATGGDAIEQVSGSMEWVNVPRAVLLCSADPDDESRFILSAMRAKLSRPPTSLRYDLVEHEGSVKVEWRGETSLTPEQLLESRGDATGRSSLAEACRWLREELDAGEVATKDLQRRAEDAGIAWATLRRAKSRLGVAFVRRVLSGQAFCVWHKPEGGYKA